jgi:hypothetical protein
LAGLLRSVGRLPRLPSLLAACGLALASWLPGTPPTVTAEQCAFPFTPTAYEDLKDRKLFLNTIELAAFNKLFPGDPYFGLPDIEIGPREARTTQPANGSRAASPRPPAPCPSARSAMRSSPSTAATASPRSPAA